MEEKKFDDLKKIKNIYGEKFSHLCRDLFPTLLETPGLLWEVISKKFAPSHSLYDAIISQEAEDDFKSFIYSFVDVEKQEMQLLEPKTPKELLDEAGYVLFPECTTEAEVQSFKKYYAPDEALCTFNGGRLNRCRVWFAVKKDVKKIKRENFSNPKRQDEYGTSVISIQFSKGKNSTLSIKNRYNHTVNQPDATFSNNLDNIIPGLTQAFVDKYNITLINKTGNSFELDHFVMADDGKFYQYNHEMNNVYYCKNNHIIDNGQLKILDKKSFELVDYFVVDKINKTIKTYDDTLVDAFPESIGKIKEIKILSTQNANRIFSFVPENGETVKMFVDESNQIKAYENLNAKTIGDSFLYYNENLETISLPNATTIGDRFLFLNESLETISLPNVTTIGYGFLNHNESLETISLPNVTTIGDRFLSNNKSLETISLPNVTTIGNEFLYCNENLETISLPNVTTIGGGFLYCNRNLKTISLPNATTIGYEFLSNNKSLETISLPNVTTIGNWFLYCNKNLETISLPNVTTIGGGFLYCNRNLKTISLPNATTIGYEFLYCNRNLKTISLPNVTTIGDRFLSNNKSLETISLPNVTTIGVGFLYNNKSLKTISLPNVTTIGNRFLYNNKSLKTISLPNVTTIGYWFLYNNKNLETISLPNVTTIGNEFLYCNENLETISLPNVTTIGDKFLSNNKSLETISLPNVTTIGDKFLVVNFCLNKFYAPKLQQVPQKFQGVLIKSFDEKEK